MLFLTRRMIASQEVMRLLFAIKALVGRCEAIEEKLEVMQCQLVEIANGVHSFQDSDDE